MSYPCHYGVLPSEVIVMSNVDAEFSWPRAHVFELSGPAPPLDARGTLASGVIPAHSELVARGIEIEPLDPRPHSRSIVQRGEGRDLLRPLYGDSNLCLK